MLDYTTILLFQPKGSLKNSRQDQLKDSIHGHDTPMICFDYHRMGGGGRAEKLVILKDKAKPYIDQFKLFHAEGQTILRYRLL